MSTGYNLQKAKRGAILSDKGKTRITIYIDDDVLDAYRHLGEKKGKGYQTLMNEKLRESLEKNRNRIDSPETLRKIIREELRVIGQK